MDKENSKFEKKSSRDRADQKYDENAIIDDSSSNFSDEEIKPIRKKKKMDHFESSDSDNDDGIATKSMTQKQTLRSKMKRSTSAQNYQDEEISTPKLAPNPFFKMPGSSASVNDM